MQMSLAAGIMDAKLIGIDQLFTGVSIDSRVLNQGDLFVAIPGEKFDGHDYITDAVCGGASGAVVERVVENKLADRIGQLKVNDTTVALGKLAQNWRCRFDIPLLAVTGSNGKTTVTAMIREILAVNGSPLSPRESFNNQWGVPLTLLKLNQTHSHAVIEMGMNHAGEIDLLTNIARPTVALINNIAAAHLEGLGNLKQVADAKAEIIHGMGDDGVVVLNADDQFYQSLKRRAGQRKVLSFALTHRADCDPDVVSSEIRLAAGQSQFILNIGTHSVAICLPLPGLHNISNALAAATVCHSIGISIDDIVDGLGRVSGVSGRLDICHTPSGATLIDDSFNANPASTLAAINVLSGYQGKRILVLGAMAELGSGGEELHQSAGAAAARCGIEKLLVLAEAANSDIAGYLRGFGQTAECFDRLEDLVTALQRELGSAGKSEVTVLVKGSKSSRMGRVVNELKHKPVIREDEPC
jgi:UDP-N-acetylmuramoyl-tripeptide--D-alanyl-D-alanine ligase